jgi:two-component system OmpR family response regulator
MFQGVQAAWFCSATEKYCTVSVLNAWNMPMMQSTIQDSALSVGESEEQTIMLVEDDPTISEMVALSLVESGFRAVIASTAAAMDAELQSQHVDLILLDVMLPGEDGFSICRRLRAQSMVPIIMLTARGQEIDRVVGLEIGADDYVTKPFSSRELVARIRAQLRRVKLGSEPARKVKTMSFCGWRLEVQSRQLFNPSGVRITLTGTEFDLLAAFCQNAGKILSRDQLLELTHSGLAGPIARSVDVHISRIRQKIEPSSEEPDYIKTVRLGGYVFTPVVAKS